MRDNSPSIAKKAMVVVFATVAQFLMIYAIVLYQRNFLMDFTLQARAVLMIVLQWLLLVVPICFMVASREKLSDIGFSKINIPAQVCIGIIISLVMALCFTILPILLGFKDMVGVSQYTKPWQFLYQFLYMTVAVALVEEVFFRGFLFTRLLGIKNSKWFAIIVSSIVFGFSHIISGSLIQSFVAVFLGILFCVCRDRIKNCTTLSLIIAHGFYNAFITLFVAIL